MEQKLKNIGLIIASLLLIVLVIFNVKQCNDSNNLQSQIVEMKQLEDGIIRSQAKYVSKADIDKLAKDLDLNLDTIKDDLKNFRAEVKGISVFLAQSVGRDQTDLPSSGVYPRPDTSDNPYVCPEAGKPCSDPYGYLTHAQVLQLTELFSDGSTVPIGKTTFESWKEKPWTVYQHPRDYYVTTVLGQDEDGRHYTYNKFQIGVDGKKHTIPITKSEFVEELPLVHFQWWNPRVGLGLAIGASFNTTPANNSELATASVVPSISMSPFSYGKTKVKPDWIFARVGIGYDVVRKTASVSVAPGMWNLGSKIEFIQNSYIGPVIGIDSSSNVLLGFGFTTDF
ncbi:MAG: hypothetical protein Q8P20_00540 [bacterium]|nr:hypothetical protein [bacterium]